MSAAHALAALLAATLLSATAGAAEPWVSRPNTLPASTWAFDVGVGGYHVPAGNTGVTGAGVNLEGAVGLTPRLQLGLRTGVRAGNDGKLLGADAYGRLYDSVTFGGGTDTFANPEASITGAIARAGVVEVALQGRAYLPFERNTSVGLLFGVPVMFHLGGFVRIDTGGYIPLIFSNPLQSGLIVPVDVWFQVTDRVWLGPLTGMRFRRAGEDVRIGAGLGVQVARIVDLKAQLVLPQINQDGGTREFGFGGGIQVRIE